MQPMGRVAPTATDSSPIQALGRLPWTPIALAPPRAPAFSTGSAAPDSSIFNVNVLHVWDGVGKFKIAAVDLAEVAHGAAHRRGSRQAFGM